MHHFSSRNIKKDLLYGLDFKNWPKRSKFDAINFHGKLFNGSNFHQEILNVRRSVI